MIPDYSVIGRRIQNARLENKLTQEELADLMDISVAFMSRVETGKAQINLKRLIQISEVLHVSPGYLLTGSNKSSNTYLKEDFKRILDDFTLNQSF